MVGWMAVDKSTTTTREQEWRGKDCNVNKLFRGFVNCLWNSLLCLRRRRRNSSSSSAETWHHQDRTEVLFSFIQDKMTIIGAYHLEYSSDDMTEAPSACPLVLMPVVYRRDTTMTTLTMRGSKLT